MKIDRPPSRQPMPENARRVFTGKIFDTYQWDQKMYDGSFETFEKLKRPDTAIVFPVLPDGRILLSRQEQPGKKPFISGLGGRMEEGEDVIMAAARELREESGYAATEWALWKAQQPISKVDWAVYILVAYGAHKVSDQNLDAGEKVDLMTVTFDEFLQLVRNPIFAEFEIALDMYEALLDPAAYQKLKALFTPA